MIFSPTDTHPTERRDNERHQEIRFLAERATPTRKARDIATQDFCATNADW